MKRYPPGPTGQSDMRRPTDIHEVAGSILGPATYLKLRFGHEIISTAIPSSLPTADSNRAAVSYCRKWAVTDLVFVRGHLEPAQEQCKYVN